jgi:DNA helicase-2/ATP-dependent DNA helicase PcrA
MEADWIASKIAILKDEMGLPYNGYAVFYRTNAQSRVLEDALRTANIPYVIVGGVRFYERAEVKDVLAYLKLVSNPKDDVSFKRVINFPTRGIGKTSLEAIEKFALAQGLSLFEAIGREEILSQLMPRARENVIQFRGMVGEWVSQRETLPVFEMLKKILDRTKIIVTMEEEAKNDTDAAERLDNVQEMLNATEEFEEKSQDKTVHAYLEQVSLITDLDLVDKRKNGVTLMTIHIAKGLEFPVVFLTGLEEGLFPLGETQFDPEELEEERRIAYVGMTRAKDRLYLTSAATRRIYGQTKWNLPSRFIEEAGLVVSQRKPAPEAPSGDFEPSVRREFKPSFSPDSRSASGEKGFRVGQRVRHPEFGAGKITQQSGSGEDLKVVVLFDSGQWKKLLVKYAPLEKD